VTNWLVRKNGGNDANGGTGLTVRSTGTDAVVNATSGLTLVTSFTATWTSGDIGHGINVGGAGGKYRLISAVTPQTTATVTTSNGSPTVTSAAAFTSGMVGQGITGPGIPANTVVQSFTSSSSITISQNAGVGFGTGTATFYVMLTTTGPVNFTAGTLQSWTVGGPWATFQQPLSTNTPVVGGDSVYFGAGIYREQVTCNQTTFASTVNLIGDVDGAQTTDPGEVRLDAHTFSDIQTGTTAGPLNLNSKTFMAFSNIVFVSMGQPTALGTATNSANLSWTDCAFFAEGGVFSATLASATASNLTWDRCYFYCGSANVIVVNLPGTASGGGDYDANILVRNCIGLGLSGSANYLVIGSGTTGGTNTFLGGGITVRACSVFGMGILKTSTSTVGLSTSKPCYAFENVCWNAPVVALSASVTDNIVEDFNLILSSTGARTSIVAGAGVHTNTNLAFNNYMFSIGHERIWGALPRPFGTPIADSYFANWGVFSGATSTTSGGAATPTVDLTNRPRPSGNGRIVTSGTATSGGANTLTDTTASFSAANGLSTATIKITSGTGNGQYRTIRSNTGTVITTATNWVTNPDNTSTYQIYFGGIADGGQATSGSISSLINTNANWQTNQWVGFTVEVLSGSGSPETAGITANTATTLTISPTWTAPSSTSVYVIYRKKPGTPAGVDAANNATVGALSRHDSASKETVLTDAGGVAWRLFGWSDQEILIPVDATPTSIAVKCSFDTDHGNTNKPQAILLADAAIGVSGQTVTATGTAGSGTFETLTFSTITHTAKSWVVVRFVSRADKITGRAIFDTVSIS